MRKKTIIILTCVWGRPEVTEFYIKGLKTTQSKLKDTFNFINIIVDSDNSNYDLFNNDSSFNYFNHPNLPVSNKWNYALSLCKNFEYDYVLMMGSDDLICDKVLKEYDKYIELGYHYIGITDLFIYNIIDKKFYYWGGYSKRSGRFGESIGLGRCVHKSIIENLDYKLWMDNIDRGLDGSMERKIRSLPNIKKITFKSIDHGVSCDIKSKNNITKLSSFINQLIENDINDSRYQYVKNIVNPTILSIIIPTFNNVSFLTNCFDSILKSIKNLNCEILVGIDSCYETKKYVENNTFDDRFKFYFFETNLGPYVIKNTLSTFSNSDYLLFFDSDDIMNENMINYILNYKESHKLIKPMYLDFINDENNIKYEITKTKTYGEGVFAIDKETFIEFNGFRSWRCGADSEFMNRVYKKNIKFMVTNNICFYRRIHPSSLTQHPDTNYSSKKRRDYFKQSNKKLEFLHTSSCYVMPVNYYEKKLTSETFKIKPLTSIDLINKILQKKPFNINNGLSKSIDKSLVKTVNEPKVRNLEPKNKEKHLHTSSNSLLSQAKKLKSVRMTRNNLIPNVFGGKKN